MAGVQSTIQNMDDMKARFEQAIQGSLNNLAISALQAESSLKARVQVVKPAWTFKRLNTRQIQVALGSADLVKQAAPIRAACQLDAQAFKPIPRPKASDRLSEHEERGQSYAAYTRRSVKVVPCKGGRDTMHLVPIGEFDPATSPALEALRTFSEAFFTCRVEVRVYLLKMRKPKNSFCAVAVTMHDLYTTGRDGMD